MSRTRIALAAASVIAGMSGAVLVLLLASGGEERASEATSRTTVPHTPLPAAQPPAVSLLRASRCVVDSQARVVRFRLVLQNSRQRDWAIRVHPWVGFTNGGEIQETSYDQLVGVPAAATRQLEISLPYEPRIDTPSRCQVLLGAGQYISLGLRRS